jgi:hypothetical protein
MDGLAGRSSDENGGDLRKQSDFTGRMDGLAGDRSDLNGGKAILAGGNCSVVAPRDGVCVLWAASVAALKRAGDKEAFLATACAWPSGGTSGGRMSVVST